jgi:murein DD-endopeptidase MepM/ murein hydrolase activator NlpD
MPVRQAGTRIALVCAAGAIAIGMLLSPASSGHSDHSTAAAATLNGEVTEPPEVAAPAEAKPVLAPKPGSRVVRVKKGDTLMDILVKQGVPRPEAHEAITALAKVFNPRKLMAGQDITLTFGPGESGNGTQATAAATLQALRLEADFDREVGAEREAAGGFGPVELRREFTVEVVRTGGEIETSLFEAAQAAGLPPKVLIELIRAYSYDVDFQRDLQPGDSFEVMFEQRVDAERKVTQTGDILFASMTLSGDKLSVYRYAVKKGDTGFFNEKGESVRKALLRTPVDGARLSSRYGKRKHPVLGYTRMHRGIDFAAPKGAPIIAAGDGFVAKAGRNGNYGKYIEIRHNAEYHTAYGHLSRFAKGLHKGKRVKQGQVIGYVGSTGLSTGPHLHFEVIRDKRKINPLSVKLPSGHKLKGADLEKFLAVKGKIDKKLAALPLETKVASAK